MQNNGWTGTIRSTTKKSIGWTGKNLNVAELGKRPCLGKALFWILQNILQEQIQVSPFPFTPQTCLVLFLSFYFVSFFVFICSICLLREMLTPKYASGHIAPINNRVDGSHGIAISDWPPRGTQNDPERRVWNTISTRYIEKLFQMSTWQRSYNLQNWRTFNIPRDGATSLYINSFTTMSENEEQRVAREELAEAVALANAQPAKKKRVKATGKMEERRPKDEKIIEEAVIEQEQQPESSTQQIPAIDGKRRASSPGALPGQRLILAPHSRRPSSGLVTVPERPPLRPIPPRQAAQTPLTRNQLKPVNQSTEIYPKHSESLTDDVPKEITSENIKKMKKQPKGILAAYRQRRRIGLEKKEAEAEVEAKRTCDLADGKISELQRSLIREEELEVQLAVAREESKMLKEAGGVDRRRALADNGSIEIREVGVEVEVDE